MQVGIAKSFLLASIAITCSCKSSTNQKSKPKEKPKQIIIICLDTLRSDRLDAYGYHRNTAPNLSALARQGVMFRTVVAQSSHTLISHKSIFSAKYPLRLIHEATNATLEQFVTVPSPRLALISTFRRLENTSLVGRFRDVGYRTGAFTDGGWMQKQLGFEESFDTYNDEAGHLERILPRVFSWLDDNKKRPFFLFVHSYDTHCPYPCREPYNSLFCKNHIGHVDLSGKCGRGKHGFASLPLTKADLAGISDHYDGGIASADAHLGVLLSRLKSLKIYEDALIIVTSDHGESLGEHGLIGHGGLYLEQLLVPLIIKFPAAQKIPPAIINDPVAMVDVMPTLLELVDLDLPHGLDGRSLMPVIGRIKKARRYFVAQTTLHESKGGTANPAKRALLDPGRWLLINDARDSSSELFDLEDDPRGLTDITDRRPDQRDEMLKTLTLFDPVRTSGSFKPARPRPMSDKMKRQLESLGYVGN